MSRSEKAMIVYAVDLSRSPRQVWTGSVPR
jgi:hypothetical protein